MWRLWEIGVYVRRWRRWTRSRVVRQHYLRITSHIEHVLLGIGSLDFALRTYSLDEGLLLQTTTQVKQCEEHENHELLLDGKERLHPGPLKLRAGPDSCQAPSHSSQKLAKYSHQYIAPYSCKPL